VIAGLTPETMRDESVQTAALARQIVKDRKLADTAFAAGIVHDVGQIVLARDSTKRYGDVFGAARTSAEPLRIAEMRELGVTHGTVGAYLLGVWGLPYVLAETVAFHDEPSSVVDGNVDLLGAVHLADGLLEAAREQRDPLTAGILDLPFLEKTGLLAELPKWHAVAVASVASQGGRG
jgi:HD-like signal output (HDOD) protein